MDCLTVVDMAGTLFQTADFMAAVADTSLKCVWANDMAKNHLPALLLDDGLKDFLCNLNPNELSTLLSTGQPYFTTVGYEPFEKMQVQFLPVIDPHKNYIGSIVLFKNSDVVNNEQVPQQLAETSAKGVIAAFTNEYRMPLTIIFSTLSLLSKQIGQKADDKIVNYLQLITQNCYRLLRLSNNIAEIARYWSGADGIQTKNGDICHYFQGLCHAASLLTSTIDIPLESDIPDKSLILAFDPQKLSVAFLNIISNSCKFTRKGNRIKVRVQLMDSQVVVTVSDRGQGIKQDMFPLIFRPYFTYDPDGKPYGGAGLGLSLAKYIIAQHKGTIAVQSEEGKGTSVSFTLPIAADSGLPDYTAENGADYLSDRFSTLFIELSDVCRCPMP